MQSILRFTYFECRSHIIMSTPCHALFVCTILWVTLMSIVLKVHPGVQLYTRVDSKKSFCRSVTEGTYCHLTVLAYSASLFRIGPR